MLPLVCLPLLLGEIEVVVSADFSRELQTTALTATVRIVNPSRETQGSGVVLGRKGSFVYVLTAHHVVDGADRLEVSTFSATTYPRPCRTYRSVRLVARADDMRDLALLRVITDDPMPSTLSLCPARLLLKDGKFKALAVGCTGGRAPTCAVDEVAGKKKVRREAEDKAASFWEVDRRQSGGDSGGPLVDKHGRLLGVCSGTNKEKTYYCHPDEIRTFLKKNGFDWLI